MNDFHLTGPRRDRVLTTVDFMETKSVVLRLKKGTFRFFGDPHSDSKHGSFRVVCLA